MSFSPPAAWLKLTILHTTRDTHVLTPTTRHLTGGSDGKLTVLHWMKSKISCQKCHKSIFSNLREIFIFINVRTCVTVPTPTSQGSVTLYQFYVASLCTPPSLHSSVFDSSFPFPVADWDHPGQLDHCPLCVHVCVRLRLLMIAC